MEGVCYHVHVLGDGQSPRKEEYFCIKYVSICVETNFSCISWHQTAEVVSVMGSAILIWWWPVKWAESSYRRNINCVVHDGTLLNIFIYLSTMGMCHLNTELLSSSTVRGINYRSECCVKQCQTCFTPRAWNRTSYDLIVGVCSCMHFTYWRDPGLKLWYSEWVIKDHRIF